MYIKYVATVAMVALLLTVSMPSNGEAACAVHPPVCGENEVYKQCGTACPATCDNMDTVQACTKQCVAGCFCVDGYVLNDKGQCVPKCLCPKQYNTY
ncbi:chymotrypsin-elastase inhibitor ixodidin-like [Anopheles maculipalpis]|uniref:chymotrypsin-elastase inhibitor ixodidin-like n=1 Tax=Anopheles maculipalpis TaxID=1496333 RepID=UPI00215930A5|nr:chymotrypsin-elastase inhibitor ixodidin-like [Anopheles maculipalpis]